MSMRIVLPALAMALATGCKGVDCGEGTAERNGECVASSATVGAAKCGPFTELHGDTCVPMFPPTMCDPSTTAPDTDSAGVTTCIGTGGGGCAAKLPCPTSSGGKQTICGQIYDFETSQPFAAAGATGAQCTAGATSGPCALGIKAYDAVAFVMAQGMGGGLGTGAVYIDDCGRYRVSDIDPPGTAPLIALGFDDTTQPGPPGITNAVGVATGAVPNSATKDLDGYVVRAAVASGWGSPMLSAGIYATVYHGHRTGTDLAANVQFTFGPMSSPPPTMTNTDRDFYFAAAATTRVTLEPTAGVTGINGAALVSGANLGELYSGKGGLPSTCIWDIHGGAAVAGVVFIQSFRPTDAPGMTCPL
jgi:hypothetical protein